MGVVCGGKVEFGSGAGLLPQKRLSICNKNFKVRQVGPQGATLSMLSDNEYPYRSSSISQIAPPSLLSISLQ